MKRSLTGPRGSNFVFSWTDSGAMFWAGTQGDAAHVLITTVASGAFMQTDLSSTDLYETHGRSVRCVQ